MAGARIVEILITGNSDQAVKEIEKLVGAADAASAETSSAFSKIGGAATIALAGAAVVVAGFSIKMADDFEASHARLQTAVKNTGQSLSSFQGQLSGTESKMEGFGFSNAQVENALSRLVPAVHDTGTAINLMGLAADIARARHMDLESATQLLVKVETGHVALLGRLGIATKDSTGATISQQEAIKRLTEMYGGSASAYSKTFAGQIDALKASMVDLGVQIGQFLIPIIQHLASIVVSTISFFERNTAAAIALGVAIGGPLVAAMVSWIATQTVAMASGFADFLETVALKAMYAGDALSAFGVSGLVAVAATAAMSAGLIAVAYGAGYLITSLLNTNALMVETTNSIKKGAEIGTDYAKSVVDAANKQGDASKVISDALKNQKNSLDDLESAKQKGLVSDQQYIVQHVAATKAVNDLTAAQHKLTEEHKVAVATTTALADVLGVKIPASYEKDSKAAAAVQKAVQDSIPLFGQLGTQAELNVGLTATAMEDLTKDAKTFATNLASSIQQATDPFTQFSGATSVGEQDMENFFVQSNQGAQKWMQDIQRLMSEGVNTGIVQELAQAGPKSEPELQAFQAVIDKNGVAWVNSIDNSTQQMEQATDSAFNQMAVTAAVKSAEMRAISDAEFAAMTGHGTDQLVKLTQSSDANLSAMAKTALQQMGLVAYSVNSLPSSHPIYIDVDSAAAMARLADVEGVLNRINGRQTRASVAVQLQVLAGAEGGV